MISNITKKHKFEFLEDDEPCKKKRDTKIVQDFQNHEEVKFRAFEDMQNQGDKKLI